MAEGAEEDSGENDFAVAGGDEGFGFGDDVITWLAPEIGPELGDDAVGAVGIATILDFEEGALVGLLVVVEEGEG